MANSLDWVKLISVNPQWVNNFLISHTKQSVTQNKIVTRVYSIKFASNGENMNGLVSYMRDRIVHYSYSKKEIKELEAKDIQPWPEARDQYFGPVDPTSDGKCGELLLYLLVEAVLKSPLIAHKIKCVSDNPNTQVHGSDGVFVGEYNGMNCMLLGEAKMRQTKGDGLNDALKSVNKFYDPLSGGQTTKNELTVIRDMRSKSITKEQLKYLEEVLNVQSNAYRMITKVHPILVVYDDRKIKDIEIACKDATDGEARVSKEFQFLDKQMLATVVGKITSDWNELQKVYLDFFFIPVTSIDNFRGSFYRVLWGTPPPKRKQKRKRNRTKQKGK